MATRFFTPLRCVQNDIGGRFAALGKTFGWRRGMGDHGGRISTRGQRVGEDARRYGGGGCCLARGLKGDGSPPPRLHGGRISTRGQRVGKDARCYGGGGMGVTWGGG